MQPSVHCSTIYNSQDMEAMSINGRMDNIYAKYMYIHLHTHIRIYVYIYIERESEREREKAMAPHSSTLAWKIPWAEEPGRLQSMRSLRVGDD